MHMAKFKFSTGVFFPNFLWTSVLSVAPLIPLFWTSGDICPGFQCQGASPCLHASWCILFL